MSQFAHGINKLTGQYLTGITITIMSLELTTGGSETTQEIQ